MREGGKEGRKEGRNRRTLKSRIPRWLDAQGNPNKNPPPLQRARELNATGLSPCCLRGASSDSSGGGAAIMKTATQGRKSSAIFRSCSASIGAWVAVFLGLSPVGVCWKPPLYTRAMQASLAQRNRPCNQTRVTQFRVWD